MPLTVHKPIACLIACLFLLGLLNIRILAQDETSDEFRHPDDVATLVDILPHVPRFLGYERQMRYLILLQTSDELRPSGGFIKLLVYLSIENGQVTRLETTEVTQAEPPNLGAFDWVDTNRYILPPLPIQNYLGLGNWVIRDANWWLDFRHNSEQVHFFWEAAGYEPVDAVIALNDIALFNIIDNLGGFQLADGQTLTGVELQNLILDQFYVNEGIQRTQDQLALSQSLAQAFIDFLLALPRSRYPFLISSALQEIFRNDIMVSFNDPVLGDLVYSWRMDGALRATGMSDYLYIVDSNVSYSKASQMMDYYLSYNIRFEENGSLSSQISLNMSNNYSREERRPQFPDFYYDGARWLPESNQLYQNEGYYGSYLRFALPEAATILSATGFDADADYSQRLTPLIVYGGYLGLEAGESQTIQLAWTQESRLSPEGTYIFYIQRQPGLPDMTVDFSLSLAPCMTVLSIEPTPDRAENQQLFWTSTLSSDSHYELQTSEAC